MKLRRILTILFVLFVTSCAQNYARKVPIYGLTAAFSFCPTDECSDMSVGKTTKQLPFTSSQGIYDKWCVEVHFKRDNKSGQAAVVVIQTDAEDSYFSWESFEPVYNADCSIID